MLLMLSSNLAAIAGERSQTLQLPGSALATITPILVFVVYVIGEFLSHTRHRAARWVQTLVLFVMIYPVVIYHCFSHSIETPGALSHAELQRFKARFGVQTIMLSETSSFEITVANRAFRPEMVEWLRENASSVSKEP